MEYSWDLYEKNHLSWDIRAFSFGCTGSILCIFLRSYLSKLGKRAVSHGSSSFFFHAILRSKGTEGDVLMVVGLWRIVVVFLTVLVILSVYFQLGAIGSIIGAFGGMFLGWSLQSPVSGFAAWLIVTVKRPFRVGDRIQLPSHNLVGDIVDVGLMYTVLNQVGGSVGSEEPVGRHILIPNAMLFGNLVINYTPPLGEEKVSRAIGKKRKATYILDEVVIRLTYDSNWEEAENILLNAAKEVTSNIIEETRNEPYIRSDMYDYGVWLRLRYLTSALERPKIRYEIEKRIFKEFQENGKVDFAIPYVYSAKKGIQKASSQ
jgi:small-conductance mechanosensitive channel